VVGYINVNILRIIFIPGANSNHHSYSPGNIFKFGNEAVDKERLSLFPGIGDGYPPVKLCRGDEFNQLICSYLFPSIRDESIHRGFRNPGEPSPARNFTRCLAKYQASKTMSENFSFFLRASITSSLASSILLLN
jgi:hypothetical protein